VTAVASGLAFASIHLPARDLAESRTFYVDVLGGEPIPDEDGNVRLRVGDIDVVLGAQERGATGGSAEYPHYAFTVTPEQFLGIKRRLDAYGVPTNEPWTRAGKPYALMYFRDPAGNQFELFSPEGCDALPLRIGARAGGDYTTDFAALTYAELHAPRKGEAPARTAPTGFNHMTLPVHDLAAAKRFLVDVIGAPVIHEVPDHVTTLLGGAQIGVGRQNYGWTPQDAEFPCVGFRADAATMHALRERFEAAAVPVHVIPRAGGGETQAFRDPSGN
jgi:glutathione S-transferase fosA5